MNYTIEKVLQDLPQGEDLKKIPEDGGDEWNRLVFEKSPYLDNLKLALNFLNI